MANRKSKSQQGESTLPFWLGMLAVALALIYALSPVEPATSEQKSIPTPTQETTATPGPTPTPTSEPIATLTPDPTATPTPEPTITPEPTLLMLHQIDVGCANAYLVQFGTLNIFIDGGEARSMGNVREYLRGLGVSRIDIYIGTHWHGDHVDNMANILYHYGTSKTIVYGASETPLNYLIPKGHYQQMKDYDVFSFYGGLTITCVGPYKVRSDGTINYDSLNFVIEYGEFKALMTADYIHDEVLDNHYRLTADVDVLQMPHHGLDPLCISSKMLLHADPAVILVPANSSGPTKGIASELGVYCNIYDNKSGNVVVVSDGTDYEVRTNVIANEFES